MTSVRTVAGGQWPVASENDQWPVASEISVETVSDYRAFLELEPVWNQLVEAAAIDHPFLEHAWVRTWWECFGAGSMLQVLVLKAAGEPIAIAPLILTSTRMWGIKIRRLGFFYNSHVPRADFIIASRRDEVYGAIWRHLLRSRNWDVLQLCQLPAGSKTLDTLPHLAASDDCPTGVWFSGASPYLSLDTTWEQYFGSLVTKHRSNLRNRFKRLKQVGPVELEALTSETGLEEALKAGLQLEAAAWKGAAGTAISCDREVTHFYSALAVRAVERGWLLLNFLRVGSHQAAFDYSLHYRNTIYVLKSGYAPAYSQYSPYNLLLTLVLEKAYAQGVAGYDFLGAAQEWKLSWTSQSVPHYWLFVFPHTARGRFLHWIKFRLIPLLKREDLSRLRNLLLHLIG